MGGTGSTAHTGIDLYRTILMATDFNMHDAFAIEGSAIGEGLAAGAERSATSTATDNDDLPGERCNAGRATSSSVPWSPSPGFRMVNIAADFIIDAADLGRPAERMGDLNADGRSDLAFIRHDDGAGKTVITVIFGGRVMPRTIDSDSLEPLYSRTIELEDTLFNNLGETSLMIASWSGHVDVQTGLAYNDLVALSTQPGATNSYGYIFSGDAIKANTTVMGTGDALVDLKLFTTTVEVADNRVPVRVPDLYTSESEQVVTIAPVHTVYGTTGTIADATQNLHSEGGTTTHAVGDGLNAQYFDGTVPVPPPP